MRYMMLVYTKEQEGVSREQLMEVAAAHHSVMDEAKRRGIYIAADPLQPTATATTVRTQQGKPVVIDGPFAETKEQLAGYYILECKDLDEALEWAAKIPTGCGGNEGCIEVRPIHAIRTQSEDIANEEHAKA
jgi:hypothetical protein